MGVRVTSPMPVYWDIAKLVRHQILALTFAGSSPAIPSIYYINRRWLNCYPYEAAKMLGMSTQTLRLGLQQNKFPFGTAIVTTNAEDSKTGKPRWTYYINEERLAKYLRGDDIHKEMERTFNNAIIDSDCVDISVHC